MGVYLTAFIPLVPDDLTKPVINSSQCDRLILPFDEEVYEQIRKLPANPLQDGTQFSQGTALYTREDDYHEPLHWVRAGDLAGVIPAKDSHPRRTVCFDFFKALHPDEPVILYWH